MSSSHLQKSTTQLSSASLLWANLGVVSHRPLPTRQTRFHRPVRQRRCVFFSHLKKKRHGGFNASNQNLVKLEQFPSLEINIRNTCWKDHLDSESFGSKMLPQESHFFFVAGGLHLSQMPWHNLRRPEKVPISQVLELAEATWFNDKTPGRPLEEHLWMSSLDLGNKSPPRLLHSW